MYRGKGILTIVSGGEEVLHQEEDEAAQMQSPTGDVCASYLLADGRRSSKFGGRVEEGVEIGDGAWWEVTESFPSPFAFR
jgi:hypothetical protein